MTISKVNFSMGRTSESCWGDSMEDGLSSLLMNEEKGPDFNLSAGNVVSDLAYEVY